mmetsp:Transcript_11385/g.34321  ORF Transcript_11385/g.34321 Transcript_11385/m.34321 type:complete len:200 (-) Transcript_11385:646-1245(-)
MDRLFRFDGKSGSSLLEASILRVSASSLISTSFVLDSKVRSKAVRLSSSMSMVKELLLRSFLGSGARRANSGSTSGSTPADRATEQRFRRTFMRSTFISARLFLYSSMKAVVMMATDMEIAKTPMIIVIAPAALPAIVLGTMSPYPTPVMVARDHQRAAGMDTNSVWESMASVKKTTVAERTADEPTQTTSAESPLMEA